MFYTVHVIVVLLFFVYGPKGSQAPKDAHYDQELLHAASGPRHGHHGHLRHALEDHEAQQGAVQPLPARRGDGPHAQLRDRQAWPAGQAPVREADQRARGHDPAVDPCGHPPLHPGALQPRDERPEVHVHGAPTITIVI